MRKIVLLIITSVILVFWGCSSDKIETFDSGQYLFQNDTLTVAIYFENDNIFWRYGYRHINLPSTMQFKSDDRTLDSNGDGILDWAQIL